MKRKLRRGRPPKDRRWTLSIAAAIDYRGSFDDQLTFVFRGCPHELVTTVFRYLCGHGNGIARSARITEEHDPIRRNGKGYWRIAAQLTEPNFDFCTLDDMKILVEAFLRRSHPCTVQWFPYDKFLNI